MELIGTLPEVSGLVLYKQSHAGYDVGSTGADWKFGKTPKPGSLRFKKSMLTVGGK